MGAGLSTKNSHAKYSPVLEARKQIDILLKTYPHPSHQAILSFLELYIQTLSDQDLDESTFCRVFTVATALVEETQKEMRMYRLRQLKALLGGV